ncbi:Uncharacterised protein [Klebsiella michiganensis]|uniref:Uncharacterized protein n=1 Tax=Klebsiella michiganensis TaxID=1134687 RepID=A0A7H4N2V0_9ENTR|nr:Uncharacterised protein [Klebsiella michiganensis]
MRAKQALRTQDCKTGIWVGLRQQIDHIFACRLAAGEFVGETLRAEILRNIAMMVIIKIERRRRDMHEVAHAPGNRPLAETPGRAHVS